MLIAKGDSDLAEYVRALFHRDREIQTNVPGRSAQDAIPRDRLHRIMYKVNFVNVESPGRETMTGAVS